MRKNNTKFISRLMTLAILLGMMLVAVLPIATYASETQFYSTQTNTKSASEVTTTTPGTSGNLIYFKEDTSYDMINKVAPLTFEFELSGCTHIAGESKGGVIIGNYSEDASTFLNIEVIDYGKIIVRGKYNGGSEWTATFYQSEADIRVGGVHHYTITVASGWTGVSLYVDGILKATRYPASITLPKASDYTHTFRIGGDYSAGNTNYFKGRINSVAMFSDIRTASEISADKNANKTWSSSTDKLVAAYDLTKMGEAALRDYSGNNNKLFYNNGSGIQVENFGKYEIEQKFTANLETFEAWIYLPDYYTDEIAGTIFGNYRTYNGSRVVMEVYKNGNPRLFYTNANGTTSYHRFTDVDLRTGSWQHLAIVHDVASGEARCYVNGELKQTLTENVVAYGANAFDQNFLIGRDTALRYAEGDGEYWENRKDQYFKGFIKEINIYSDVRTADEIAADYQANPLNNDGLLASYKISPSDAYTDITDLSGNGYTAKYKQLLWEAEYVEPIQNNYAYSLAIVGDTQTVTDQNPELLKNIYQWILNNQASKNIQYVIGLGDITEYGVDVGHTNYDESRANAQWTAAKDAITLMDGQIPYSLIRGNGHDGIELFNEYFANHEGYTSNIAGYYQEGRIDNVYHTFTVGSVDYLLLCLDHGTKDDVLVWANEVVATHPNHQVIVTTHHYMKSDGTLSVRGESGNATAYDPNNNAADDLWNKFLSKYPNISMVICGHADADDVVVAKKTGNHGNEVTQILINPQSMDAEYGQGSKGMVAMLYFSEDGTDVQVQYYSTIKDTYRPTSNFTVSTGSHTYESVVTEPTCTEDGYTTYTCTGCEDSYVMDIVPATGHTEEILSAVAPTCASTGLTEGKKCTVCQAVTVAQSVVDAFAHTETTIQGTAPTCTLTGFTEGKKCTVCGDITVAQNIIPANGHSYNAVVTAPTCENAGYTTYTCSVCGDSYVANNVDALGHSYDAVVTAPTCTEAGYTTYTCSVCGDSYVGNNVGALGHTDGAPVIENNVTADCVNGGGYDTVVYCSVCGYEVSRTHTEVSANGHSYDAVVTVPTCTEAGYTTYTCTVCGYSYVGDEVAALGHTDGAPVIENNVTADCVNDGGYDTVVYCSVCTYEVSRTHTEVPANGHSYNAAVTAPTCTMGGYTTYTCIDCGYSYIANETDVVSHSIEILPGKDATCTETGLTEGQKCTSCGETLVSQEEISALGHKFETIAHEPTCTEPGYTTYVCVTCGHYYADDMVDANGHKWIDATTEAPKTCEICGETEGDKLTEVIPDTDSSAEEDDVDVEPEEELSAFEKFWQSIINFFRRLFGLPEIGATDVAEDGADETNENIASEE